MRRLAGYFEIPESIPPEHRRWYALCLYAYPLAGIFHTAFLVVFHLAGLEPLARANIASVLLWIVAAALNRRGYLNAAFPIAIFEVIGHAAACVYVIGWDAGFQYFIIDPLIFTSLSVMRMTWKWIAWTAGMASYIGLYFYGGDNPPLMPVDPTLLKVFYVGNVVGTFWFLIFLSYIFDRTANRLQGALEKEHERSESLLHNILPKAIANRLKDEKKTIADAFAQASVLFCDIVGFTTYSSGSPPEKVVSMLNDIFSRFDDLAEKHGLEKIKTIGDAYMVAAGIPKERPDHAQAIADMALDMLETVKRFNATTGSTLQVRIGINSGPVVAGVIGKKKFIYDLWGDTVNTASRMESFGVPGEIQVTEATAALLGTNYVTEKRGTVDVKGKGPIVVYLLKGRH